MNEKVKALLLMTETIHKMPDVNLLLLDKVIQEEIRERKLVVRSQTTDEFLRQPSWLGRFLLRLGSF